MTRRLQVGMWNGLDKSFWDTYANGLISGIEAAQFKHTDQMEEMAQFCKSRNLKFGIHSPVREKRAYSLPNITSLDYEQCKEAYERLEQETMLAARYGADYLLTHYPCPSIMPARKDTRLWPIFPQFERYEMEQMSRSSFEEISRRAFDKLSELQVQHRQRIVVEYDFFGDLESSWVQILKEFPDIMLVLDMQRLDIHRRVFPGFEPYRLMEAMAKQVYLVHYSNINYENSKVERHLPVLSNQTDDPDYGDAYKYLEFLSKLNDRFHLTFEHNPSRVTRSELEECYSSAAALMMEGTGDDHF